jgi:hypothetical protein
MGSTPSSVVRPLSSVVPYISCPECGSRVKRSSKAQEGTESLNGAALWVFTESCIMCEWYRSIRNVKIGA